MERVRSNGLICLAPETLIEPAPNLLLRQAGRLPNATSDSGHGASFKVQDLRTNLAFLNKADPFLYAIKLDKETVAYWTSEWFNHIWINGDRGNSYKSISTFRIGHVLFASKATLQHERRLGPTKTINFIYDNQVNQAMCLSKSNGEKVNITSFEDFKINALQEAMNEDDTSSPSIIVCDLVS